jgi:hypothetical protein
MTKGSVVRHLGVTSRIILVKADQLSAPVSVYRFLCPTPFEVDFCASLPSLIDAVSYKKSLSITTLLIYMLEYICMTSQYYIVFKHCVLV